MSINYRTNRTMLAAAFAAGLFGSAAAYAQTAADDGAGAADTNGGNTASGFESLSPGGQKIARSLFESQEIQATGAGDGTGDGTTAAGDGTTAAADGDGAASSSAFTDGQPATLDQIAKAKADGSGWGQVFKEMKAAGLVSEKNLGQVISKANRAERLGGVTDGAGDTAGDATGDTTGDTTGDATGDTAGGSTETGSGTATAAAGETALSASAVSGPSRGQGGHRGRGGVVITLANGQTMTVSRGHGGPGRSPHDTAAAAGRIDNSGPGNARGHGSGVVDNSGPGNAHGHGGNVAGIVSGSGGQAASGAVRIDNSGSGNAHGHGGNVAGIVSGSGGQAVSGAVRIDNSGPGNAHGHGSGNGRK